MSLYLHTPKHCYLYPLHLGTHANKLGTVTVHACSQPFTQVRGNTVASCPFAYPSLSGRLPPHHPNCCRHLFLHCSALLEVQNPPQSPSEHNRARPPHVRPLRDLSCVARRGATHRGSKARVPFGASQHSACCCGRPPVPRAGRHAGAWRALTKRAKRHRR